MVNGLDKPQPLVSIFCMCKNAAKTIRRCIDSILKQDYPNIEIIVQDGASTDGTLEILRGYGDKIKLVSEPDSGPTDAMFRAWSRIRGEFFGSCLADEELLSHAVSWGAENLQKNPDAAAIYTDHYITDIEGNITGTVKPPKWDYNAYLCSEITPPYCSSFFRTDCYRKIGFTVYTGADEFDFWINLGSRFPIQYVPCDNPFAKYAVHPGSISFTHEHHARRVLSRKKAVEKLCNDHGTPEHIRSLRDKAIAGVDVWCLESYCCTGLWDLVKKEAQNIFLLGPNPEKLRQVARQIFRRCVELHEQGRNNESIEFIDLLKKCNVSGQEIDSLRERILLKQAASNRPMKQEQKAQNWDPNSNREKVTTSLNSTGWQKEQKCETNGSNCNGRKYRILMVNTDYDHFLKELYGTNPELYSASFSEQYSGRAQTLFGLSDFYSSNLRSMGHPAVDLFYNNRYMQYAWAVENGFMPQIAPNSIPYLTEEWLTAVFQSQVRTFKPDVIINLAMEAITSRILNSVKKDVPLIIGQHAAPITNSMQDLSAYDMLLSSLPNYVEYFRQKNKLSRYFKLCFEPSILESVPCSEERPNDIAFVGSFSSNHMDGVNLFNYLAEQNFSMYLCGYGQEALSPMAAKFYKGTAYGKEMYEIYSKSKIIINRHINISGEYANNLRLYEATGMGALLVTDWKKNLNSLFDTDNEVVTYTSKEQCAERIRYYLENAEEGKRIAKNGQKRTLCEHNCHNRMAELVEIVEEFLTSGKKPQTKVIHRHQTAGPDSTEISVDASLKSFEKLKQIASQNRFAEWSVKFNGLTIYCHDILSFYMAAKDIFLHRIYDFEAKTEEPVIIDGGGHIGLFTLFIKQKYPKARVTVFEPDKESLELLRKNLEANGYNDVDIVEAGLYKQDGTISFGSDHSDGSSIFAKDKTNTIVVVRLSKYIESGVDLVKLNIEGAELDVITEIKEKLPLIKNMVIEYHGFPEIGQNLHKLLAILSCSGFRYTIHDFDSETNPAAKPPFRLDKETRFFLLITAKKMIQHQNKIEKQFQYSSL